MVISVNLMARDCSSDSGVSEISGSTTSFGAVATGVFASESAVAATSASATTDSVGDELTVPVGICASGFSGDGGDEVCSSSGRSCCGTVSLIVHSFQLTDISGKFDVESSVHELMVDP